MLSKEFIRTNFSKGKVTIVASWPPSICTSFAESLLFSLTVQGRCPVYFSMGKEGLKLLNKTKRLLNTDGNNGRLSVNDSLNLTVKDIRHEIEDSSVDYVVINRLQDIECEQLMISRKMELKSILQGLKELAEEFKIPVVVMALLKRRRAVIGVGPNLYDIRNEICDDLTPFNIAIVYPPENYGMVDTFCNGKKIHGKIEFVRYKGKQPHTTYFYLDKTTKEMSMWHTRQRLKDEL